MRYFHLLCGIFSISLQRELAFRTNLIFEAALTLFSTTAGVLALSIIFDHAQTLAGWTFSETIILLGTYNIVTGILNAFVQPNLAWFANKVTGGELDDTLLQPVSSIFMVSMGTCQPWALSESLMGLVLIGIGLTHIGADLTLGGVIGALILLAVGTVITWASRVMLASLAFWMPGIEPSVLYTAFWQLGRYPVTLYHPLITQLLTYVIPVAFIATIPARTLTRGLEIPLLVIGLVAAVSTFWLAKTIWRLGLSRYTSATS